MDTHRYASLRIEDPFADPFERIGLGWKALVQWMEKNNLHLQHQTHGNENPYCLEEILTQDGVTCMDICLFQWISDEEKRSVFSSFFIKEELV